MYVGRNLIELLNKENADIYINDVNEEKLEKMRRKYDVKIIKGDIFSLI